MSSKKVVLIIMDGWGHGPDNACNAIAQASTPFISSLYKKYPNAELLTSGENVGLPDGQMGNSEVGHLNLGAGRIVYQELGKINKAIREKSIDENPVLLKALDFAKKNNKRIHLLGLVSDGGVHSHTDHLKALCNISKNKGLDEVYVHAFMDGRDTDPRSGLGYIKDLENCLAGTGGKVASVIGRYYAMDRDKRWERVKLAYDMLLEGKGKATNNVQQAIEESYQEDVTDEFIKPIVKVDEAGNPVGLIKEDDVVICFNFRTDRCREITEVRSEDVV